jgi:hypothetical protein
MAKKLNHITTVTEAFRYLNDTGMKRTIQALLKDEAAAMMLQAHAATLLKTAEVVFEKGVADFVKKTRHTQTTLVARDLTPHHVLAGIATMVRRKEPTTERMFVWTDYYNGQREIQAKMDVLDKFFGSTSHAEQHPVQVLEEYLKTQTTSYYTDVMTAHVFGMFQNLLDSGYKCVVAMPLDGNMVFTFTKADGFYGVIDIVYRHVTLLADLAATMGLMEA